MRPRIDSVQIHSVENGFIVEKNVYADSPATYAFETLDNLLAFLRTHFTVVKQEQEQESRYDADRR